jgi:LPS export ABC transporter protein LptC/lipopolysaccharide transport protein LptA
MQEVSKRRSITIGLRAHYPVMARLLAFVLLAAGIAFVGVSYYKLRNNQRFLMKPGIPELSKEVTGRLEGYEQHLLKNGRLFLLVKASVDLTFSDSHHELENVSVAVYPEAGEVPDQITAARAIYQPTTSVISFLGNVKIETKDRLKVNTESLSFDQNTEVAQTDAPVTFERDNVTGKSTGAMLEQKTKKLQLHKDVEVTVAPKAGARGLSPRSRPVIIKASHGVFEQLALTLTFSGGVTAEQDTALMSGDALHAFFNKQQQVERAEIRGNSYLRTMEPGRAAELKAVDMDFFLDGDQRLQRAAARQNITSRTLDGESDMQLSGASALEVLFQAQDQRSALKEMTTQGRSIVTLSAPKSKATDARAANKRLTADVVKLVWRTSGRDLEKAEANGNAELFIDPVVQNVSADRKTLVAQRFDCDFFESGNLTRQCIASGGAKAVIDPVQSVADRGTRTLTSQKMTASFLKDTQDVERVDAQGDSKFNERDRNGIAANVSFTTADETVRLRGGEPTVWDSRGRTKAVEIDSDLTNEVSYGRGRVSTTYYSQEQTNGATPFTKIKSPVYVVAERVEFRHVSGLATYTGNARAWQDDNFVRGDKLNIYVNDKKMDAAGRVQTAVYNSKRRIDGNPTVVPVFATSESMFYSDTDRVIHYEGDVDIKQGPDRITAGVADAYLMRDTNDMDKTIAQRNVVLTQPNRRGTGDWIQYTTADETAVLKGNPARVDDTEQGNTEGARLTMNVRDGRVTADDTRGPLSPGRVRTSHKIKKP